MREVRYLTDDRDRPDRMELVIQQGGNGDIYVSVVPEGETPVQGVRLATSGGCAFKQPKLVFGLLDAMIAIEEKPESVIQATPSIHP